MQHARPTPRAPWILTAAATGFLLVLVGCTQVGDNLTGVDLSRGRPTTCIKECNDFYKLVYDQEQKAHQEAMALCKAVDCGKLTTDCTGCPPLPDGRTCCFALCDEYKTACQQAEGARHSAEQDRITQAKKDCQDNCHNQGSGSTG